jgi:hypothetical protein
VAAETTQTKEQQKHRNPWPLLERGGAFVGIALLGLAAWRVWWPFNTHPNPANSYRKPSIWQLLLSDRLTLGFARALILALAVYVAGSVVALMIARRWLRAFGTGGVSADDAESANRTIEAFKGMNQELANEFARATAQIDRVTQERDQARELARSMYERERRARERARTSPTRPATRPIVQPEENDERRRDQENP